MAEVLLARRLHDRGIDVIVESAGTNAMVGHPADPLARELMTSKGLDLSSHKARQLTSEMIRSFDLVLVMEAQQQRAVEGMDSSARGRVHRLGRMSGFEVPDPYRRGRAAFEASLALIERGVDEIHGAFWSKR